MTNLTRYAPWLVLPVWLFILLYWRGDYWMAHWYVKWTLVLWTGVSLASFAAWWQWFKRDRWAAVCFAPLGVSLVYSALQYGVWARSKIQMRGEWPHHWFYDWTTSNIHGWSTLAYSGALTVALALALILLMPRRYRVVGQAVLALTWAVAVAGVAASWGKGFDAFISGSFSGNASMHGCLIACLWPFVLGVIQLLPTRRWPWLQYVYDALCLCVWPVTLVTLLHLNQSAPLGVFGVVSAALWVAVPMRWYARLGVPAALAAALIGAGYYMMGHEFFSSTGRWPMLQLYMKWWAENANAWTGAGSGSMVVIGPKLMKGWMWLHNDWAQVLFEQGILGLIGAVSTGVLVLIRAWHAPALFAACAGWATTMLLNYPLRLPVHAACLALTVWIVAVSRRGPKTS